MDTAVMPAARNALLDLNADPGIVTRNRMAVWDVLDGVCLLPLAWALGWLDIRLRYRRSVLGAFWLTLSTGVMGASLGYLYVHFFHTE